MRRVLQNGSLAICLGLAVIFASTAANAQKKPPIGELLDRMDKHSKALTTLVADVTMVKTDATLGVSDTYYGTTSYIPKTAKTRMFARIDWSKPQQEQMLVDGDTYELYRPRLNQLVTGKVKQASGKPGVGNALAFMNMSKEQLRLNFKTAWLGEERISGGVATIHLQLTPLQPTSYRIAELWVDSDGMPRQAKVVQQNNDSTTILLSKIKKNETLRRNTLALKYPKSVKKLKG